MKRNNNSIENSTIRFICFLLVFNGFFISPIFSQNIPNTNFANAIRSVCPTCIDGANNLTTDATTLTSLDVSNKNISSLAGLEGFTNLEVLDCYNNPLMSLPTLPSQLKRLNCGISNLTTLPTLPSTLTHLSGYNSRLTSLPTLPSSLVYLHVDNNQLMSLPTLPSSLRILYMGGNQFSTLPTLPSGLVQFSCWSNPISALPATLPSGLTELGVHNTPLSNLPTLPTNLQILSCYGTTINCLPTLPMGLTTLQLDPTRILCLPNIPTNCTINNGANTTDIRNSFAVCGPQVPDVNFANAIRTACPTCIDGCNQLTAAAAALTSLNVSSGGISSLTGLEYFTSLQILNCSNNPTQSLPTLPNTLTQLNCSIIGLTSLPTLPSNLQVLTCYRNRLTSLPTLPNTLLILYVDNNELTSLPTLPSSLRILYTGGNQLTTLPTLPSGLTHFSCWSNAITALPNTLPSGLTELGVHNTSLSNLPTLPTNLQILSCYGTTINCLPTLPMGLATLQLDPTRILCLPNIPTNCTINNGANTTDIRNSFAVCGPQVPDVNFANAIRTVCPTCIDGCNKLTSAATTLTQLLVSSRGITDLTGLEGFTNLKEFDCSYNYDLTVLPNLPLSLEKLNCGRTGLSSLPTLPNSLQSLYVFETNLTSLPTLPNGLTFLHCAGNKLTSLPALPNSLIRLYCNSNKLTSLPVLPSNLFYLDCSTNQLTSLPTLPNSLSGLLDCSNNPLQNLPTLPSNLSTLLCRSNQLTNLPTLPTNLLILDCTDNNLQSLPTLTNGRLSTLTCSNNPLSSLPTLPANLYGLYCVNNQLQVLPALPAGLTYLDCHQNNIYCLSSLPSSLVDFTLDAAKITCLPNIPASLRVYDQTPLGGANIISRYGICNAPFISLHPSVMPAVCLGNNTTLSAQAVSNGFMFVKWQRKGATDANFTDIPSVGGAYASGTVANFSPTVVLADNGASYRAVFGSCFGDYITNPVTFNVSTGLHIPNANFATAIRNQCANCIDNCDNLTSNAANLTTLNVSSSNITDLTGIEAFTSLQSLYCNFNGLTSLPSNLPSTLTTLSCTNTLISSLPTLPNGLRNLYCGNSFLNTLPTTLPTDLRLLDCANAYLTALPATLPSGLLTLNCSNNQLTSLPNEMPVPLIDINVSNNRLTSLSAFYNFVQYLYCQNNQLTSLPSSLPANLRYLRCQNNQLTELPYLIIGLLEIECYDNNIYCLPTLPTGLTNLKLDKLKITCLPNTVTGLVIQNRNLVGDISNTYTLCTAPSIVTHPSVSGMPQGGQPTNFTAKCTNNSVTTVKWQRKGASDMNFTDIAGSESAYATNTDALYNTPNLTNADIGASYRAVFTTQCSGDATTNAVTLNFTLLPVELLHFKGKSTEGGNLLTWATAEEKNTSNFEIERSSDGRNFEKIGVVKSRGSHSNYQFLDELKLSTSHYPLSAQLYYRLKINDLDAKTDYSKIISIESKGKTVVKIYPSVTTGELTIENAGSYEIINMAGQIVLKGKQNSGNLDNFPNLSSQPNGFYLVKGVDTEGVVFTQKVMKQ